jgi:hypothetical protein
MSRKRKQILWTTLIIVALVSISAGAVSRRAVIVKGPLEDPATKADYHAQPTIARGKKERLGYALVTLTRFGFEPTEITRRGGRFFLVIENRSEVRNLTLRLDPEHGNRLIEITQPNDQLDWVEEMKLPPGRYRISTADQPDWSCWLTVTP